MTTTTRSLTLRSLDPRSVHLRTSGRRLVGALSAGAAVAVIGVTAVPVGAAVAAGIHRGPVHLAELSAQGPAALPDPAALLDPAATPTVGTVVLRHDGAGSPRCERRRWAYSARRSRGQPAHSTHPGSA